MIKPANDTTFYWYAGQCSTDNGCDADTLWRTQNGVSESYAELSQAAFSVDGSAYTWIEDAESDMFILYTRQSTQTAQDYIYLPGNRMMAMVWAPFGTRLVIMTSIRDDYTGKTADARVFMVESNGMTSREHYAFPASILLQPGPLMADRSCSHQSLPPMRAMSPFSASWI